MLKIFDFFDIWFLKQDIQKWLKPRYAVFYGEFKNEKTKGQNFWIFPPMIWIFMSSEEPEIKSKQASKRDRTLKGMLHPQNDN